MTPPPAVVVPAETLADLQPAAVLLVQACNAVPDGQVLGSAAALAAGPADLAAFLTVLAYACKAGHVDLAVAGGRLVGVACWIRHRAERHGRRERTPGARRPGDQDSGGV